MKRPVLRLAEQSMSFVAQFGGGRPVAWWLSILTVAPHLTSMHSYLAGLLERLFGTRAHPHQAPTPDSRVTPDATHLARRTGRVVAVNRG